MGQGKSTGMAIATELQKHRPEYFEIPHQARLRLRSLFIDTQPPLSYTDLSSEDPFSSLKANQEPVGL